MAEDFKPFIPRLYTVGLGMGYLELPQVSYSIGQLEIEDRHRGQKFFSFIIILRLPKARCLILGLMCGNAKVCGIDA